MAGKKRKLEDYLTSAEERMERVRAARRMRGVDAVKDIEEILDQAAEKGCVKVSLAKYKHRILPKIVKDALIAKGYIVKINPYYPRYNIITIDDDETAKGFWYSAAKGTRHPISQTTKRR